MYEGQIICFIFEFQYKKTAQELYMYDKGQNNLLKSSYFYCACTNLFSFYVCTCEIFLNFHFGSKCSKFQNVTFPTKVAFFALTDYCHDYGAIFLSENIEHRLEEIKYFHQRLKTERIIFLAKSCVHFLFFIKKK